jgi:hypothetical protein
VMMCARSVSRSINALYSRGFGIYNLRPLGERQIDGHDHRRLLRPVGDHLEHQLAGGFGERHVAQFVNTDQVEPFPSAQRTTELVGVRRLGEFVVAVVNRTLRRWRQAATHNPVAKWVFPVPASPTSKTGSALATYSPSASVRRCAAETPERSNSNPSSVFIRGSRASCSSRVMARLSRSSISAVSSASR